MSQQLVYNNKLTVLLFKRPIGIGEEEALNEAIRQSREQAELHAPMVPENTETPDLPEVDLVQEVKRHSEKVVSGDSRKTVVVSRLNLWKTTMPYFKLRGFLENRGLIYVTFATFTEEEDAVDLGGPRREFFHLVLVAICKDSGLLTSKHSIILHCQK